MVSKQHAATSGSSEATSGACTCSQSMQGVNPGAFKEGAHLCQARVQRAPLDDGDEVIRHVSGQRLRSSTA